MELNSTSVRDGGSLQENIVTVGGSAWDCKVRSKMDSISSQEALRRVLACSTICKLRCATGTYKRSRAVRFDCDISYLFCHWCLITKSSMINSIQLIHNQFASDSLPTPAPVWLVGWLVGEKFVCEENCLSRSQLHQTHCI